MHIELKLQAFTLGLASIDAAKSMHGLPLNPGLPRSEVALWTEDVDQVVHFLREMGVPIISEPHTFIGAVRAAWLLDPEGNHVQVVARSSPGRRVLPEAMPKPSVKGTSNSLAHDRPPVTSNYKGFSTCQAKTGHDEWRRDSSMGLRR